MDSEETFIFSFCFHIACRMDCESLWLPSVFRVIHRAFLYANFQPRGRKIRVNRWITQNPSPVGGLFTWARPPFSFLRPTCPSLVKGLVVSADQPLSYGSFCHQQYIHHSRMTPVRRRSDGLSSEAPSIITPHSDQEQSKTLIMPEEALPGPPPVSLPKR